MTEVSVSVDEHYHEIWDKAQNRHDNSAGRVQQAAEKVQQAAERVQRAAGKAAGEPDVCVRNVRKAVILLG